MVFYILVGIGWIAMTFLSMFLISITIKAYDGEMFNDAVIFFSILFCWAMIPLCIAVCIIKLIAYPFRKRWW